MVWVSAAGSVRRRTEGELRRLVQGRLAAGADRASREAEGRGMCFSGEQQLCRRSLAACPTAAAVGRRLGWSRAWQSSFWGPASREAGRVLLCRARVGSERKRAEQLWF